MKMNAEFFNNPIDLSESYHDTDNDYYLPGAVKSFNEKAADGTVEWSFHRYTMDWFFNKIDRHLALQSESSAPFQDYDLHPELDFSLSFISDRTVRLRMKTSKGAVTPSPSLMIDETIGNQNNIWSVGKEESVVKYFGKFAYISIDTKNFSIEVMNAKEEMLTSTVGMQNLKGMHTKATPFSFTRQASDYSVNIAASFTLRPDEKIYGCGESFTALNKRGQKLSLFTCDTQSTASQQMYKPIPFFFSSRGYGMFVHTSAPLTFDFGYRQSGTTTIYSGDEFLDLFLFIGSPQEILQEYTLLTGRSPLPPLWSFGLWMGCFSYKSETEVREVADKMREMKFPCDVIHIDAGWFKNGINCDFEFCTETFPEPAAMMEDLKNDGFRTSLWQIPYFTPNNPLYGEIIDKKLFIKNGKGDVSSLDAILDFSKEETIRWYEEKLSRLLQMGASAIKVDFGEAAPISGLYASGKSGWYEHNLYPLRYNKVVADLTRRLTNENIIWARSAWAGSQRYPLHWGGDAEVSDTGMAGTLRGGLSIGLSGFSFWSHDIGGFSGNPDEDLFSRWSFFGLMSSHSRVHGFPPREPWHYSKSFQSLFRSVSELRYKLIPYIYSQAASCSSQGLPLMRALLLNYSDDPTVWNIDDQYLLGNDILIAPLLEENTNKRWVYLPRGRWFNLLDKKFYEGARWHQLAAGELRGVILFRYGSLIPIMPPAQSTAFMNWNNIKLIAVSDGEDEVKGFLKMPNDTPVTEIKAALSGKKWEQIPNGVDFFFKCEGYQVL